MFDIKKAPMVRVTWLDARDTETGWLDIKEVVSAPLAVCQEVGWMVHNGARIKKITMVVVLSL